MQEIIDKSHGWFRDWFRKVWEIPDGEPEKPRKSRKDRKGQEA